MARNGLLFVCFCLLLSACAPANVGTPTLTALPSLTAPPEPTKMATLAPSATPLPSKTPASPTITPLPTIPTFTPTFDVRTIVTATPAPKAECPNQTNKYKIIFPQPEQGGYPSGDIILPIFTFLNSGGNADSLRKILDQLYHSYAPKVISYDVTNDSIPEIIVDGVISENGDYSDVYIFMCNHEQFMISNVLHDSGGIYSFFQSYIIFIDDLNLDGIPEIVTKTGYGSGGTDYIIYEWDGSKFKFVADFSAATNTEESIRVDHNGYKEIEIISHDSAEKWNENQAFRDRDRIFTIEWNGENFSVADVFSTPQFRFQVIQDADSLVSNGAYNSAMSLYQDAIFSNKLDWWSKERALQQSKNHDAILSGLPTPTPLPPDPTEYPRLAAYAYYRMIILHTYLGEMDEAKVQYATIQEKFPVGNPAHPYAEMAIDFWNAYQSSGKMYDACAAAIAYADAHPEILTPLGSDYHGAQSHIYVPADVCPFR